MPKIEREEYEGRVRRALALAQERNLDCVLIFSAYMSNAGVRYFAGYNYQPSWLSQAVLLLSPAASPILITDKPWFISTLREEVWVEDIRGCGEWLERPGQPGTILSLASATADCLKELALGKGRIGMVGFDLMPALFYEHLKRELERAELLDVTESFERLRMQKSASEIELLRSVARIADSGMEAALNAAREGVREVEVAAAATEALIGNGADVIFALWVVSGEDADKVYRATPVGNRRLKKGDMVWIDMGMICRGYFSDIGRATVVGEPSPEQGKLLQTVYESHQRAAALLRPGVKAREIVEGALVVMDEAGYRNYVTGNFLGHGIGVTLDEYPVLVPGEGTTIEPRMVINIDCKLFVPGLGGSRLENCYLVREEGAELLHACPQITW